MILADYERGLPPTVVARCADTGSAHGTPASGFNTSAAENVAASLKALSEDMALAYARWLAQEAS